MKGKVTKNQAVYEKLSSLLQYYLPVVQTFIPASTLDGLKAQISQITKDGQYFIPLNINCLSQNFENGENDLKNNHWAGFYVVKSFGEITGVVYIDPMGKKINSEIFTIITNQLKSDNIREPLLNRPVQYFQLDAFGTFIEEGNYDDCGAFLVYCVTSITSGKKIRQDIKTPEQAISFGQYLRDVFEKRVGFDDIYKTVTSDCGKVSPNEAYMSTTTTTTEQAKDNNIKAAKVQLSKDEKALTESITELEKKLFPQFHTNTPSLPNFEEERARTLNEIRKSHTEALKFFKANNFKNAEQEIIKVLRPVLSKPETKALYVDVKDVLEEALSAMYHLGLIYLNESNYFNNHAKAAAIFQYCSEFSKEYKISLKLDGNITGDQEYFIKRAHFVEYKFCLNIRAGSNFNSDNAIAKSKQYKDELEQFRSTIDQELKFINDLGIDQIETRTGKVKNIYSDCTSFFVNHNQNNSETQSCSHASGLVQRLLKDCYEQLGPVPEGCEYAIVGLGSLALGTMNPWSDLEFAVLINEDKEEYKEYFRNLTKLLWIKVINLQETPLSALGVEALNNYSTGEEQDNWFNDNLTQKAFRFDPVYEDACKSPLGRQGNYKVKEKVKNEETGIETEAMITKPDYELIMTPEQMLVFQHRETEEIKSQEEYGNIKSWFEADKHLSQALQAVSLIDGSQELLKEYRVKLREWQSINPALQKGRALELLNEDVSKFSLKLGAEEEGKLLDAKQTIYRLGDRIVSALAGYYGITAEDDEPAITVWQIIDKMKAQGVLNDKGVKHLSEAISIAIELRIRAYSHNQGRYDNISIYEPVITDHLTEEKRKELIEKTFHFKKTDILKHFYCVMLRVQYLIEAFCDQQYQEKATLILKSDELFDDNNYTQGMVYARFLEYDKAIKHLEVAKLLEDEKAMKYAEVADKANAENLQYYFVYVKLDELFNNNNYTPDMVDARLREHSTAMTSTEAVKYLEDDKAIKYVEKANKKHLEDLLLYNLYFLYVKTKTVEKAFVTCKQILKKIKSQNNPDLTEIAEWYNNLGNEYNNKGEHDKAIKYHDKALKIRLDTLDFYHYLVAGSYNNLGWAHYNKGEYEEAVKCHQNALKIRKKVYQDNPNHPDVAMSYSHLGIICSALKCYNRALNINLKAYEQNPNHPSIAGNYHNLGAVYLQRGEYKEAIKYHKQALAIQLKVYSQCPNHPDIAMSYNNLGVAYCQKTKYDKAENYHKEALRIYTEVYKDNLNHASIAKSYLGLGNVYSSRKKYDSAIEHYEQALDIYHKVYTSNPRHPDIITCYSNLADNHNKRGITYFHEGDYDQAIIQYNQALDLYKSAHDNLKHPDFALVRSNLGNVYYAQGGYNRANSCYIKALKILDTPGNGDNSKHKLIVKTMHNATLVQLGNIALFENDIEQARMYYGQIDPQYKEIPFNSEEFLQLQFAQISVVHQTAALDAAINCQLVLIKVYHESELGNYYHNLACLYACKGNIDLAQKYFFEAFKYKKLSDSLCVQYAQFLIINVESLNADPHIISKHLYVAIENDSDGSNIEYNKLLKNSVCNVLKDFIEQEKAADITFNAAAVAYYLLIKYPQYIAANDNIDNLLRLFSQACDNLLDKISFRLLANVYAEIGYKELTELYYNESDTLAKIDDFIDNTDVDINNIDPQVIQTVVNRMQQAAEEAISKARYSVAEKFYQKIFSIYNKILLERLEQLELAVNNLATVSLLAGNIQQFIHLKFEYKAKLNTELVKLSGQDIHLILDIDEQVSGKLQAFYAPQPLLENDRALIRVEEENWGRTEIDSCNINFSGENSVTSFPWNWCHLF